jgi:hypothetical protein
MIFVKGEIKTKYGNVKTSCLRDFDNTKRYWYKLDWNTNLPSLLIIAKNPSKANESRSDHTTTRCIYYAKSNNYGSIILINFDTYYCVTTTDCDYKKVDYINIFILTLNILLSTSILCAWGGCKFIKKSKILKKYINGLLELSNARLWCIKLTCNGEPYHPAHRGGYIDKFIQYLPVTSNK